MNNMEFPGMLERFFSYVKIDTQSSEESTSYPSTQKQFNLLNKLKDQLDALGLEDVTINKWGYVLATLKTNQDKKLPTIALIGHVDTSPDVSGENVNPQVHKNYDGSDIVLSKDGILHEGQAVPAPYAFNAPGRKCRELALPVP